MSIEVGPIDPSVIERLKAAGYAVYRGKRSWRVEVVATVIASGSVRSQAHVLARQIMRDYGLEALTDPPAIALWDPDYGMDDRPELVLREARKAYDPEPLVRPPRKWFRKQWELDTNDYSRD